MDLKDRVRRLQSDIPAVFIALRKNETPVIVKICEVMESLRNVILQYQLY